MSKNHLCVQISDGFCTLSEIIDGEIKIIVSTFFEKKKDFQYKESLKDFLNESLVKDKEYDEVSVAWISPKALLVPTNIFSPNETESLFNTCFQKKAVSSELDFNRLMEVSIVCIYEIPLWVKSFFIMRYPKVVIQHEYSHLVRGMMKNSFNLGIQVSVFPEIMVLSMVNKNDLIFCNTYEINHLNDVIYYLSFAIQQKELGNVKGKINFSLNPLITFQEDELRKNLKRINLFNFYEIHFDATRTLKFQEFCV